MKNSTFNYVLRRVLVFLVISVIIMLFNACQVHAESYSLENYNTKINMYGTYVNNIDWNTNYWRGVPYEQYTGFDSRVNYISTVDNPVIFEGRYLISFIVWSNQNQQELTCNNMTSNFKNANMITGNWVSNEITSHCLDMYNVTYDGHKAIRILYEFTYQSSNTADSITELEFIVTTKSGYKFFQGDMYGLDIGFTLSDIMDYDLNIINTWNSDKSQQAIINGQQDIINNQTNNTNSIIYNQNNNTQEIINSQEELNQDLIDNQNQNTQDIIDNQNQNTQDTINSQMVCNYIDKTNIVEERKYLTSSGNITSTSYNRGITDYISLTKNDKLELLTQNDNVQYYYICFYNVNKTLISCSSTSSMNLGLVDIPNDTSFFRTTINANENKPTFNLCRNGNQALVDSLTDDSSPSLDALNNSAGWLPPGPVDSILNLPIALLNNLTTNLSKSCQPVILPVPYINQNITLPCIYSLYEQMGITTWVGLVGTIASALILFSYLAKLYKWVDDTLTFRENNHIDNWGGI